MNIVEEIISSLLDDGAAIESCLRKSLFLAHKLKNAALIGWVSRELDGYEPTDELPAYRKIRVISKGLLLGPFGSVIQDQPIPPAVLRAEDREWAQTAELRQPVASYTSLLRESGVAQAGASMQLPWPANMTLYYQTKIMGGYGLNRAWKEIPRSEMAGLINNVRNRMLKLALDLQDDLDAEKLPLESLPREKVQEQVTNQIFGGQNIIGSNNSNVAQVGSVNVRTGDFDEFAAALRSIGVKEDDLAELRSALSGKEEPAKSGLSWIMKVASGGLRVGRDVGIGIMSAWLWQYLGHGAS